MHGLSKFPLKAQPIGLCSDTHHPRQNMRWFGPHYIPRSLLMVYVALTNIRAHFYRHRRAYATLTKTLASIYVILIWSGEGVYVVDLLHGIWNRRKHHRGVVGCNAMVDVGYSARA